MGGYRLVLYTTFTQSWLFIKLYAPLLHMRSRCCAWHGDAE